MKNDKRTNEESNNNPMTDEQPSKVRKWLSKFKKEADGSKDEEVPVGKIRWVQIRLIPIWIRVILIILLFVGVAVIGLRVGYGTIGDGNPADVFKKETWTHIVDIVTGKE